MKKIFTSLLLFVASLTLSAQGWPEKYDGVMLQGFYWDSYSDTKWTNLESQADELSQYFNLIWVPNSGKTDAYYSSKSNTMGYDPCFWLDHESCWGTEDQLKEMITTFKDKGTGIIEDVVINHKNGRGSWVHFPDETKGSYSVTWDNTNYSGICKTDECNQKGYTTTGADDTGDDFPGYRDLDHTNATVQQNVKTYLKFLLNELGYAGFRYDMVKGYKAEYTGLYNKDAQPTYSVGEYWDGDVSKVKAWIDGTKQGGVVQSAAFDFPLKYKLNAALGGKQWSQLKEAVLANTADYARYAVTFVDNHDTYRENSRLSYNVCAANALILSMPGTPCLFLPHWQAYKGSLKKLILTRKAVGITNQSTIDEATASADGFVLKVTGTAGKLMLVLGEATATTTGYQLATEGVNYKLYVSDGVDISAVSAVTDTDAKQEVNKVPSFCTVADGEMCAFFEVPASWDMSASQVVKCWCWDTQYNYTTGTWPGSACVKVGTADNGNAVWKWTFKESEKKTATGNTNEGIIFNDGKSSDAIQTDNLVFENAGYYTVNGAWRNAKTDATAINAIRHTPVVSTSQAYDILGRKVEPTTLRKGTIYIQSGKKYLKN